MTADPGRTLTDTEWADAQTVIAPAYLTETGPPAYDPRTVRACIYLADMMRRDPGDDRAATTTGRAAVLLMAPDVGGTPYRCGKCARVYYGPPEPPDWELAGSTDWLCWECAHIPVEPPKAIEGPAAESAAGRVRAELARGNGGRTAGDLASATGYSRAQVHKVLAQMREHGEAASTKTPGTQAQMWQLASGGAP